MELSVRLFAGLRELAGAGELSVELPEPATVDDLLTALGETPVGVLPPRSFIVAVNRAYASGEAPIARGDEVALIPPVSGGAEDPVRAAEITSEPLDVGRLSALVRDP